MRALGQIAAAIVLFFALGGSSSWGDGLANPTLQNFRTKVEYLNKGLPSGFEVSASRKRSFEQKYAATMNPKTSVGKVELTLRELMSSWNSNAVNSQNNAELRANGEYFIKIYDEAYLPRLNGSLPRNNAPGQNGGGEQATATEPPALPRSYLGLTPSDEIKDLVEGRPSPDAQTTEECQTLLRNYVAAAMAKNGPDAKSGLDALMQAGGCGVLRQTASTGRDPRFQSRKDTPMLDQTVTPCDQQPAQCAETVRRLQEGTSTAAVAAMYSNAIGIGLQVGAMMGQGIAPQPMQAPAAGYARSKTNSQGSAAARNPSAPSAPAPVKPITVAPCAVGGPGWCTAQ